jgi:hypothetical protein
VLLFDFDKITCGDMLMRSTDGDLTFYHKKHHPQQLSMFGLVGAAPRGCSAAAISTTQADNWPAAGLADTQFRCLTH